jgi:hypothetical protein
MKKMAIILLCIFFLLDAGGGFICFRMIQLYRQEKVEMQLRKTGNFENLIPIELNGLNAGNIHWTRKNKEFLLDGHRYDVVKTITQNGKTTLMCLNDQIEEQLIAGHAKSSPIHKENKKIISRTFLLHFFVKKIVINFPDVALDIQFADKPILLDDRFIPVNFPPPKVI